MNIYFENVDLGSLSGPNSFARKLYKYLKKRDHSFNRQKPPDVILSFIESFYNHAAPKILRLDGIYFNTMQDYEFLNKNIRKSYCNADGVIIQSEFDKKLIFKYFGEHPNVEVIRNGADTSSIEGLKPLQNRLTEEYDDIWVCASSWRPHKRLGPNIEYFLEHSKKNDCLIVAGNVDGNERIQHNRVFYIGEVSETVLLRLYKTSKYLIHLAWLDHCPNVVVDAKAAGCKIICSSAGGTAELTTWGDVIVEEDEWNFDPLELYNPPPLDFSKKIVKKDGNLCYNMDEVAKKYEKFLSRLL